MTTKREWRTDIVAAFFLCVIAFYCALQDVCFPGSENINYSDGSIYQYIGHLITIGKMPYLDAFDHKGPILYLINALGCIIDEKHGIWLIDVFFMIAMFLAAYVFCRKFLSPIWSTVVVAITASGIVTCFWIGNTPDFFATVFTMIAICILSNYFITSTLSRLQIFLVGLMAALCFWMKFNTIAAIGVFCLGIIICAASKKQFLFIWQCIRYFAFGALIPTVIVGAWLILHHSFSEMVQDYFSFNLFYGTEHASSSARILAFEYFLSEKSMLLALICAAILFLFPKQVNSSDHCLCGKMKLAVTSLAAMLLQCAVLAMAGREYVHYNVILYPMAIVLVTLTNAQTKQYKVMRQAMPVLGALMAVIILIPNLKTASTKQKAYWSESAYTNMPDIIQLYTNENDDIAVASPDHCGLYLWAGRESATTYPYIQASMYGDEAIMQEYTGQISAKRPKVIVWNLNWPVSYIGEITSQYTIYYPKDQPVAGEKNLALLIRNDVAVDSTVLDAQGYILEEPKI